jgi:hypothetical protein
VKTSVKGECATKDLRHYDVLTTFGLLAQIISRPSGTWKLSTEIKAKDDLYANSTMILPVNKK